MDRWQDENTAGARRSLAVQAWAAVVQAFMCQAQGITRMLTDADEAAHRFLAAGIVSAATRADARDLRVPISGWSRWL